MLTFRLHTRLMCLLAVLFVFPFVALAQSSDITVIPIECGTVIEGELTGSQQAVVYSLNAAAGTKIRGLLEPFGSTFNPVVAFFDSSDDVILVVNQQRAGGTEDLTGIELSVSNPNIAIFGTDISSSGTGFYGSLSSIIDYYASESFGGYTLSIGCQLRDGTIINPGDSSTSGQNSSTSAQTAATAAPSFSGVGFPGLASVDFSNAILLPFSFGTQNSNGIVPGFDAVFGYTFDAKASDVFALDFKRLSGNLNLGLAVLSPDNKIVFQASLVTSDTLSTHFTLPSNGTYTIGVYKIDLLPPDSPANTAFQITGTLNP